MNNLATRGTLAPEEPHPATDSAIRYIRNLTPEQWSTAKMAFSSCAIESNRLAEICTETMNRLDKGIFVSDRYLLGLTQALRDLYDKD